MGQRVLEVRNLDLKTPGGRLLRSGIDFSLDRGDLLRIQGDNGCGKSTLARSLFVQNDLENVFWGIAPQYRGYLPQVHQSQLFLPLTILDVVSIFLKTTQSEVLALGLLPKERLSFKWNSASGGEQKRALLTRLLLNSPQVLCLDEPFNNLDAGSKELIGEFLEKFLAGKLPSQNEPGAVLLISHEPLSSGHSISMREYGL